MERGSNHNLFSPLLPWEKGAGDEAFLHFPPLLTIVDNSCLYKVYNNGSLFIVL
jgi:hypothetical protein